MEVPAPGIFTTGWPSGLKNLSTWTSFSTAREDLVGASIQVAFQTRSSIMLTGVPQKFSSISAIAPPGKFHPAAITIAMKKLDEFQATSTSISGVRCG